MHASKLAALMVALIGAATLPGCGKAPAPAPQPAAAGAGESPSSGQPAAGHHGKAIALGTATAGGYALRASRDEGAIVPGGDAPIDVWVAGGSARVAGVRFWIGTADAKGSIKAKAAIEFPAEPDHWHTHAEVPDPMPAGSRLWVEIEDDKGARHAASFGLATP